MMPSLMVGAVGLLVLLWAVLNIVVAERRQAATAVTSLTVHPFNPHDFTR